MTTPVNVDYQPLRIYPAGSGIAAGENRPNIAHWPVAESGPGDLLIPLWTNPSAVRWLPHRTELAA